MLRSIGNSPGSPSSQFWRRKARLRCEIFAEKEGLKPGVKQWGNDGWCKWWVDETDGRSATHRTRWVRNGEIGVWLTERSRKLIPETRGSIVEGTICYSWRRWWYRWTSKCDQRWRASAARRLNCDEVMQIWGLDGCKNFVGKWKELVFNTLRYFSQCRDQRQRVMWLGRLTTACAREFWICWSRVIWDLGRLR